MWTDLGGFAVGLAIGGGGAFVTVLILLLVAFTGWMDRGSH